MPRSLKAPKNPEFLVGTVAAMRLLSGERHPQNPLERETLAHLRALQLKPEVAKRIVAAFDATSLADRQHLLGHFADKSHALESIVSAAPPHAVVRDHRLDAPSSGAAGSASDLSTAVVRDHRGDTSPGSTTSTTSSSHTGHGSGTVGPLARK